MHAYLCISVCKLSVCAVHCSVVSLEEGQVMLRLLIARRAGHRHKAQVSPGRPIGVGAPSSLPSSGAPSLC